MKLNFIKSELTVPLMEDGTLEIVGKTQHQVLFRATGTMFLYDADLSRLTKESIQSDCVETGKTVVYFQYNLQGELRNPRKLLKSVRSRLMHAINDAHSKFEDEMNHLDWQMDKYLHVG